MCVYILVYTSSPGFFSVGLPMDCWGGGGYGVWGMHHGPGLWSNFCASLKKTLPTDFFVHSKKGKGLKVVGLAFGKEDGYLAAD